MITDRGTGMNARDDIPMDSPLRCRQTDLIKTQCGHCRPPRPQFVEVAAPSFLGYDAPGDDSIVATFTARFAGRCGHCDEVYGSGDHIARAASGDYLCTDCAEP